MIKRVAVGFFVIFLMFAFHTSIDNGIHGLRTDVVIQNEVVTNAAETTVDIVLDSPLFAAHTTEVTDITSTIVESPAATSYVEGTQTLTISALDDNQTRTLTITYSTEVDDQFMPIVGPFLSFFVYGGIIGAVIFSVWSAKGKRGN
jgi:hypothetical protein